MKKLPFLSLKTALSCAMFLGITFIAKAYDLERDGIYYVITHEDEDLYDYFNYEGPHN